MDRIFAERWLNNLKEYWWNKDISAATSLFKKTEYYQETPFCKLILHLKKLRKNGNMLKIKI